MIRSRVIDEITFSFSPVSKSALCKSEHQGEVTMFIYWHQNKSERQNWSPSSTPDRPPNSPPGASDVGHGLSVLQGSGGRSSVPGITLHFPNPVFGLTISTTLSTEREPSPQVELHSLRLKKVFVLQSWPRMSKKGSGLSVSSVKAPRNRMI